jgi:hypothetical protein
MDVIKRMVLIVVILCGLYAVPPWIALAWEAQDATPHEREFRKQESPLEEVAKTLSKVAVVLGAISFSWFAVKRHASSPFTAIRTWSRRLYRWHVPVAYGAFGLVLVHGAYFILQKWGDEGTISGLIAVGFLLALMDFGLLLRKKRTAWKRKLHFILALFWLAVTSFHAPDAIPLFLVVIGGSVGWVYWVKYRHRRISS